MKQNKTITPKVIFQKLADRLKDKTGDVEYLIYTDRQFEKWIQCELALSFSDIAIPVAYDKNNEIKDEHGEIISDLGVEYSINENNDSIRCDFCIVESPYLLKYVDKDSWKILPKVKISDCKKEYEAAKFHYVELKLFNWVEYDKPCRDSQFILNDFKKYTAFDWKKFRSNYRPASIISIFCVHFNDKDSCKYTNNDKIKAIKQLGAKILTGCNKEFKAKGSFIWQEIFENFYLLSVFYKIDNE